MVSRDSVSFRVSVVLIAGSQGSQGVDSEERHGSPYSLRCSKPEKRDNRDDILPAMRRLHLTTGGESHGPGLTAILTGLPAGLTVDFALLAHDLARRQHGYGRGNRIQEDSVAAFSWRRLCRATGGLSQVWYN